MYWHILSYYCKVTWMPHDDVKAILHCARGLTVVLPPCAKNRPAGTRSPLLRDRGETLESTETAAEQTGTLKSKFDLIQPFVYRPVPVSTGVVNLSWLCCLCCQRERVWLRAEAGRRSPTGGTQLNGLLQPLFFHCAAAVLNSLAGGSPDLIWSL